MITLTQEFREWPAGTEIPVYQPGEENTPPGSVSSYRAADMVAKGIAVEGRGEPQSRATKRSRRPEGKPSRDRSEKGDDE